MRLDFQALQNHWTADSELKESLLFIWQPPRPYTISTTILTHL